MSGRVATILVAILAVLLGITAVVGRGPADSDVNSSVLIDLPPSRIGSIEVRTRDGGFVRVADEEAWPGWLVSWSTAHDSMGAWPATESTRMAGVRLLSSVDIRQGPPGQLEETSHITIRDDTGTMVSEFDLGQQPLGGRVRVRLDRSDRWGTVDRQIGDLLKPESLLAWRETHLFPGLDASLRRIVIKRDEQTTELRRVGRSWSVISPITEPADSQAVQHLIDGLVVWQSDAFTKTPIPDPDVTMRLELGSGATDARWVYTAQVDTNPTTICRVSIADQSRQADQPLAEATFGVDSVPIAFLDIDLPALVQREVLSVPASEILGISITLDSGSVALEAQRTPDGWPTGSDEHVERWLTLLTQTPAADIVIGDPPAKESGEISLLGFGNLDIGRYTLLLESGQLWVGRGQVWRAFKLTDDLSASLGL